MVNIQDISNNISVLSKKVPELNIDSIFLEQNGKFT